MLPWTHAAFGYLLYSAYTRWRFGRPPIGLAVLAIGLGTQFPDLVDKTLTWTIPLLPYGRSLTHSMVAFAVVMLGLRVITHHPGQRTLATAFGWGYLSHLIGDAVGPVVNGDISGLGYILWPITAVPDGDTGSFLEFFLTLEFSPLIGVGIVLTVVSIAVWIYDGTPGLNLVTGETAVSNK